MAGIGTDDHRGIVIIEDRDTVIKRGVVEEFFLLCFR